MDIIYYDWITNDLIIRYILFLQVSCPSHDMNHESYSTCNDDYFVTTVTATLSQMMNLPNYPSCVLLVLRTSVLRPWLRCWFSVMTWRVELSLRWSHMSHCICPDYIIYRNKSIHWWQGKMPTIKRWLDNENIETRFENKYKAVYKLNLNWWPFVFKRWNNQLLAGMVCSKVHSSSKI